MSEGKVLIVDDAHGYIHEMASLIPGAAAGAEIVQPEPIPEAAALSAKQAAAMKKFFDGLTERERREFRLARARVTGIKESFMMARSDGQREARLR